MSLHRTHWLLVLLLVVPATTAQASASTMQHHPEFEIGEPRGMGSRLWPDSPVELPVTVAVSCGPILEDNAAESVRFQVIRAPPMIDARFDPEWTGDGGVCPPGLDPVQRFSTTLRIVARPEVLGEDHVEIKIAVLVDRSRSGIEGPFAHIIELPVAQVSVADVDPTMWEVYALPGQHATIDMHLSHNVTYRATCFSVHAEAEQTPLTVDLPEADCLPAWDRVGSPPARDVVVTIRVMDVAPPGQSIDLPLEVRVSPPSGCNPVESCQVHPVALRVHTTPDPAQAQGTWSSPVAQTMGLWALLSIASAAGAVGLVARRWRP